MPGRAKSESLKARELRERKDALMKQAGCFYQEELAKPKNIRMGARTVCKKFSEEHALATGETITLNHNTLIRLSTTPGYQLKSDSNASRAWLQDAEIVPIRDYCVELATRGFPKTHQRLKEIVEAVIAEKHDPRFSGTLGKQWTHRFLEKNHATLGTYWSRALDTKRGKAVNPTTHMAFYDLLTKITDTYKIEEDCKWAADETGHQLGVGGKEVVIGGKGKSVQHQQRSGSKETVTVMPFICADGSYIPPVVIYKGQGYLVKWKQNNPLHAALGYSQKGWTDKEIGVEVIKHFDKHTKYKANGRARLFIVDGHNSHYTLPFLQYARNNNIHVLCYPPHTTHVYQGLDVVVFAPLKQRWSEERDEWERKKGVAVSKENFLEVFGNAWLKTATPELIRTAFRKTGVHPIDPSQISPEAMAPSKETSYVNSLPLPAPSTPIRILSHALAQCRKRPRSDSDSSSTVSQAHEPDSNQEDDPDILLVAQSARSKLAKGSGSFLVTTSPIQSSSEVPTYSHPPLSPPPTLLSSSLKPRTKNEKLLVQDVQMLGRRLTQISTVLAYQRATIVAQGEYVGAVRAQLAGSEKVKQTSAKLPMDGMPRLVSGDDFVAQVEAWENQQQQQKELAAKRQVEREEMSEVLQDWRDREAVRKKTNVDIKGQWLEAVKEWEAERALAKQERRKAGWCKPKLRGMLLKPLPRPTVAEVGRGDEEEEGDEQEQAEQTSSESDDDER